MNYKKAKQLLADGDSNAKLAKGSKYTAQKWKTAGLSLAPYKSAGVGNVCASASPACILSCIFSSGRGAMPSVSESRINKTRWFYFDRESFMSTLIKDTARMERSANKALAKLCERLNVFSDVIWEKVKVNGKSMMELFPNVQFYDYTKHVKRYQSFLDGGLPSNYYLTFSMSETNWKDCFKFAKHPNATITVPSSEPMPETFMGLPCINGDETDLRFTDPAPCVVWLKAKGKGKKDKSGFILGKKEIQKVALEIG